ncbi:unnamed protein product [Sympodiomycopsis kandeliae]
MATTRSGMNLNKGLSRLPSSQATRHLLMSRSMSSSSSSSASSSSYKKVLTPSTINQNVLNVEYAVRGALSIKANEYETTLAQGKGKEKGLPFDSVVSANIGNPQQQPNLAQKPLTFWRQVAALTEYPALMEHGDLFPSDAIQRAKDILADVGSVGAYSHSKGAASIRRHVKEFIEQRDGGHASDEEMIYLTTGASGGVALLMQVLIKDSTSGIMIPIPQYPLYSATLSLHDAKPVPYNLNAHDDWSTDVEAMSKNVDEARSRGVDVRAIVIINPGNPTGSCLTYENIQGIIKLAHEKGLVILADEVYQANIFQPDQKPFHSFKKVLKDFNSQISNDVELISFHSISKGVTGECGRRGGYFELCNISPDIEAQVYKMASVNLCPSVQAQIGIDMLVKPPVKGDPSYDLYTSEVSSIHKTLHTRSQSLRNAFNSLEGIECSDPQGALYVFPQITLPDGALQAAQKENQSIDLWYCFQLLHATGICCVPGNGFGKDPQGNTFWLRSTFLAKETDQFVKRFSTFHKELLQKYK